MAGLQGCTALTLVSSLAACDKAQYAQFPAIAIAPELSDHHDEEGSRVGMRYIRDRARGILPPRSLLASGMGAVSARPCA
jgi:hypothetical protein